MTFTFFSRLNLRSALTLLLLTVIASATAYFLIKKANDAISEIDSIQSEPLFVARKEYFLEGSSSTTDVSKWKTYKNEKYGFEIRYPDDFNELVSSAEFGASQGRTYRDVYINMIPPVVNFQGYLAALLRVRTNGVREGRLTVFEKEAKTIGGRMAFREGLYDNSINAFVIRTFIDLLPLAIISVTVREGRELDSAKEVPSGLRQLADDIVSTFRRAQ